MSSDTRFNALIKIKESQSSMSKPYIRIITAIQVLAEKTVPDTTYKQRNALSWGIYVLTQRLINIPK